MIVDVNTVEKLKGKVCLVAGGFDPIHKGHVEYFNKAKEFGLPVLVSIDPDAYIEKKHPVLLKQLERANIIDQFKNIDYVYLNPGTTEQALQLIQPKIFLKDVEWKGRLPQPEVEICNSLGIAIEWADTRMGSSSQLVKNLTGDLAKDLDSFEEFIQSQKTPSPDEYDGEYFQSEWRGTGNEYTLETRRKIEDQHPVVIKNGFNPKKVLDVGCGPGFLMKFLHEIGVDVWGVDASADVLSMAHEDVKSRIKIGSITHIPVEDRSHDLVICREVLEHLSVLDIFKSVLELCRVSSKYVYVTTRFHPNPKNLFEVTDEKTVDPTHISLMNIQMLRLMFVLAGFRRHKLMENTIDWKGKGRVLVYERTENGA